jgi:hypothetical protein
MMLASALSRHAVHSIAILLKVGVATGREWGRLAAAAGRSEAAQVGAQAQPVWAGGALARLRQEEPETYEAGAHISV